VATAGASAMGELDGNVGGVNQDLNQSIRSLSETFKIGLNDLKDTLKPIISLNKQSFTQSPVQTKNSLNNASIFQPSHYQYNFTADSCMGVVSSSAQASPITAEKQTENQNTPNQPLESDHHNYNPDINTDKSSQNYSVEIEFPDSLRLYIANLTPHLQRLNTEQQKKVLYVFKDMQMNGKIKKSPSGLFIHLCKSALSGTLNLPEAPIHPAIVKAKEKARNDRFKPEGHPYADDPNIQWGYSPISQPIEAASSTQFHADNPYPYSEEEQEGIDGLIYEQRQADKEAAQRYMIAQETKRREAEEAEQAQAESNQHEAIPDKKQASKDVHILFAYLSLGGVSYETLLERHNFHYLEDIYADEIATYREKLAERRAKEYQK
jgi:hypothetical protein